MTGTAFGPAGMGDLFLDLDLGEVVTPTAPEGDVKLTIQQRFTAFHEANPWVYTSLVKLAEDAVERGQTRAGIGMFAEVLRWQHGRSTTGDPFKINNDFRSRYARLISEQRPDLAHLFTTRELRTP